MGVLLGGLRGEGGQSPESRYRPGPPGPGRWEWGLDWGERSPGKREGVRSLGGWEGQSEVRSPGMMREEGRSLEVQEVQKDNKLRHCTLYKEQPNCHFI